MLAEFALVVILHACAATDEAIRYQQLAAIQAAESESEWWESGEWYPEPYYCDPVFCEAYDESDGISAAEFQWMGVIEDGDTRYTWYSERVLPGGGLTELNENGRHVEGGFVVDGDGYIAVASSDYEKGTVIDTPFGHAKVYDTGCASGTIDVYTDF